MMLSTSESGLKDSFLNDQVISNKQVDEEIKDWQGR